MTSALMSADHADTHHVDLTSQLHVDGVAPWEVLPDEALQWLKLDKLPPVSSKSQRLIEVGSCAVAASADLETSLPVKRFGLFNGNATLRAPTLHSGADLGQTRIPRLKGGVSVCQKIDALALYEEMNSLTPWLQDMARRLPEVRVDSDLSIHELCRWEVKLLIPDPAANNGRHEISVDCVLPAHLRDVIDLVRADPPLTGTLTPLVSMLFDESYGPSSWGPNAALGLRCWTDGASLVIDELDVTGPRDNPGDPRYFTYRIEIDRHTLADALERAYRALMDIQYEVDKVFGRHAPAHLRA